MKKVYLVVSKHDERKFAKQTANQLYLSYSKFAYFRTREAALATLKGIGQLYPSRYYYVREAKPKELRQLVKKNKRYCKYIRQCQEEKECAE